MYLIYIKTTPFQKKNFAMEVLGFCLPYVKRYFQEHQWSTFLFMDQITQILLFLLMPILQRSKITVWERYLFKNKIINWSLGFVSTLCKKVFSGAPVKYFSLYDSNNSHSVVFGNVDFAEIKDHSLRMTLFQKKICQWKFWVCVYLT